MERVKSTDRRAWRSSAAFLLIGMTVILGCGGPSPARTDPADTDRSGTVGLASWYSDALHGRTTANGETSDRAALTAAHRSLPFGTRVRVTRIETGEDVVVRINDRGPFVEGRIIDLSRRAAEALGMIDAGVVRVRVVVLD